MLYGGSLVLKSSWNVFWFSDVLVVSVCTSHKEMVPPEAFVFLGLCA